jgi:hypothetical protein
LKKGSINFGWGGNIANQRRGFIQQETGENPVEPKPQA